MGLLDNMMGAGMDDPRTQATLALAAQLLGGQGGGMQRLTSGMQQYGGTMDEAKKRKLAEEERAWMMDQRKQAALQQARQLQRQDTLDALPSQFMRPGQKPETMDNRDVGEMGEAQIPRQQMDFAGLRDAYMATPGGFEQGMQLEQRMRKDDTPIISKPGEIARSKSGQVLWQNPAEADKPTAGVQEYLYARDQGFGGSFAEWKKSQQAPGVSVSVNTGQKGFDNTLKLRGDFRGEPVYKAHQEMQSAHAQIVQSLKQASPAGDLAGATKLMKLLDPGSVVRESELGMATAASGLMDRITNYASMVVNGTKLTPTQRKEFQTLADALYGESVKQYNGKRNEYKGIASRNELNIDDVVGAESMQPKAAPTAVDSLVDKYRSK